MPMAPGTRLGVYEIVSVLGAGGMGEVYRARDTKLGREVAIKVILDAFAADPDRVARFQREAKVLASLNHPHIAALYGMEQSTRVALVSDDGKDAFVGVYDITGTSALQRVTFSGKDRYPVWSPDGRRLTYQSGRDGDQGLFWQPADGTGAAERLTTPGPGEAHVPQSWSATPQGDVLLFDVAFQEAGPNAARMYDMMSDGRFLSLGLAGVEPAASARQEFHVVVNWFEELKAKVPR